MQIDAASPEEEPEEGGPFGGYMFSNNIVLLSLLDVLGTLVVCGGPAAPTATGIEETIAVEPKAVVEEPSAELEPTAAPKPTAPAQLRQTHRQLLRQLLRLDRSGLSRY